MYLGLAALAGLGAIALALLYKEKLSFLKSEKVFRVVVFVGTAILIVLQAFIVRAAWFKSTSWDVGALTDVWNEDAYFEYYSRYPNQYFLAGLFDKIARLGTIIGFNNTYLSLVSVSCLCVSFSVMLTAFIGKHLGGYSLGYLSWLIALVFVGLSPWILVPYSDTYAMPFTVAILFGYVCLNSPTLRWPLIVFATLIGYQIKPTVIFAGIAVAVVSLLRLISLRAHGRHYASPNRADYLRAIKTAATVSLVLVLALGFSSYVKGDKFDSMDAEQNFSMTHFLMMGLNSQSNGAWYKGDVDFSASYSTKKAREEANLIIVKSRLKQYGPLGLLDHLIKKNLVNYNDGSMAWEREGNFYIDTYGSNEFIKTVYGIDDANGGTASKTREALFRAPFYVIWLALLLGIAFRLFSNNSSCVERMIMLTLLMLSGFLLVFEPRARYLFLYLPYFVVLGVSGWVCIGSHLKGRFIQ